MLDWNAFLAAKGAKATADGKVVFPITDFSPEQTYLIPLAQGLIEIKGPDSAKFLQGQVTCDVRELSTKTTRLGAQCNPKGRMLLCFRALQTDAERILLRVGAGLVDKGLASLGKYIVFSKAKLADQSEAYRCLGVAGPNATQIIEQAFGWNIPNNEDWEAAGENLIIRLDENRYECWVIATEAERLWNLISEKAIPANQNHWNLLNIRAGLGDITPETYEAFTPQTINFQLVNGINFRKGCYTGQEIVARLHYRGTLKRHMYRFGFESNQLPVAGSELLNTEGKAIGDVVLAAWASTGKGELLASVVDDERDSLLVPNNPQKLSLLSLPYAIPTSNEAD
ncbi:YgfZ/GcvT domain-containing protein [Cellvibrio sp.]|uniref:CAF17-like 4Fe-4S cluster assembly/insertion protein YgfZ n=1 Tax=Cellvibrio sp. TaxID=1965322 RepID=UPI0039648A7A